MHDGLLEDDDGREHRMNVDLIVSRSLMVIDLRGRASEMSWP
jgi:hypothetical protein